MIYKFVIVSDEADDFLREISIDSEAKFIDLHNAILESTGYANDSITSFFVCNDDWEKEQEITLMEMDTSADTDSYVMDETALDELLSEEGQKLLYVFDMVNDRAFFMQLAEIVTGKDLEKAVCTKSRGKAPEQAVLEDLTELTKKPLTAENLLEDEDFYGDEGYNDDELDSEGFGDLTFDDDRGY